MQWRWGKLKPWARDCGGMRGTYDKAVLCESATWEAYEWSEPRSLASLICRQARRKQLSAGSLLQDSLYLSSNYTHPFSNCLISEQQTFLHSSVHVMPQTLKKISSGRARLSDNEGL